MNNVKGDNRSPIPVDEDWESREANNMVGKLKKAVEDLGNMAKNRDEKNGTRRFYEQTLTKVWRWTIGILTSLFTLIVIPSTSWLFYTTHTQATDIERVDTRQSTVMDTLKKLEEGINKAVDLQADILVKVNSIDKNNAITKTTLTDFINSSEKDIERIEERLEKLEH